MMNSRAGAATAAVVLGTACWKSFLGARVGAALLEANGAAELRRAGLAVRSTTLPSGKVAHYAERAAAADTPPGERRNLLVLGGFTMDLKLLAPLVVQFLASLPSAQRGWWRIVVMESPMHGLNKVPGATDFPTSAEALDYVFDFCDALHLGTGDESVPLSILGYSMGGGMTVRLVAAQPRRFASAVAIAPGFFETMETEFAQLIEKHPRRVHGWETSGEMRNFMVETCGVAKAEYDRLPGFIQEGMLRLRKAYGAGYFSRFSRAFFLDEADKTSLTRLAPDMAVARTPVLLLVGGADRCIDPHKCEQVHRQFGPQWCERRSLEGYGHFGAPLSAGRTSMRPIELNILTRSAVHAAQWLSFGAGRGTSPTARL